MNTTRITMFRKIFNLFKIKEDDTLNYMDSKKFPHQTQSHEPLDPKDEDEFFRNLEKEDPSFRENPSYTHAHQTTNANAQKHPFRSFIEKIDWNPKHHLKLITLLICMILGGILLIIALQETPNPLLGKWQPQKQSNVFVPTGIIEFAPDEFRANAIKTPVKYTINKELIEVIDLKTHMTIPFYIKDEKTIECSILGVKTTYKKVEK